MEITKIEESVNGLGSRVRPQIDAAKRRLEALNNQATQLIKEHTGACLLGVLALGYFVARVARRQS
jgi:hypothetical protein